jgi:DNA polymerase-1
MRVLKFTANPKPKTAILIKAADVDEMKKMTFLTQYLQRLVKLGYPEPGNEIIVMGLEYPKSGNIKKDMIVSQSNEILNYCDTNGIERVIVMDSKYYPYLSGNKKTEEYVGTVQPCTVDGYNHISVLAGVHHVLLSFNPDKIKVFNKALETLAKHRLGTLAEREEVQYVAHYPKTYDDIDMHLSRLELQPRLAVDIETRGDSKGDALRFDRGFLSTIAISDTINSGVSFATDSFWFSNPELETRIRQRLKVFFTRTLSNPSQRVYLHNGLFDAKFLIYNLFMKDNTDYTGMYEGISLFSNIHDTMIMVYLCTNSTIKTEKGLKDVARDYIGDYKIDVKDITQHPIDTVLEYNLKDTCATMWVADKYESLMIDEEQLDVYLDIFRPSFGFLLEMMMTGLPMDKDKIAEVKQGFNDMLIESSEQIKASHHVKRTVSILKYNAMVKYNDTHKKQKTEEDFSDIEFNPASTLQMRILLFDILGLKVLEKTDTGQPAVGGAILKQYQAEAEYNEDTDVAELMKAIIDFAKASKMLGTFISAFEELGTELLNGESYLRGNLKLGTVQSGRLSSSEP